MGMHIFQTNGPIEQRKNGVATDLVRSLPKSESFKRLFPNVSRIEAVYAGVDRRGEKTLYVLEKTGRLQMKKLGEGTDQKIQDAAQFLIGKKEETPDFSTQPIAPPAPVLTPPPVITPPETPPSPKALPPPVQEIPPPAPPAQLPKTETLEKPSQTGAPAETPQPIPTPPVSNALEERVERLEKELNQEREELTQARIATDKLQTSFKEHTAQYAAAQANDQAWKEGGMKVFKKHHAELRSLAHDLEKRKKALRILGEGHKAGIARITGIETRVAQLHPHVDNPLRMTRALGPVGAAAAAEAPPAAAPAPDRAPPAASAVLLDDRVDTLMATTLPQLQNQLAELRRALQEQVERQEQVTQNLIAQQRALPERIPEAAAGEDPAITELRRQYEQQSKGFEELARASGEKGEQLEQQIRELTRTIAELRAREPRDERIDQVLAEIQQLQRDVGEIRAHRQSERVDQLFGRMEELAAALHEMREQRGEQNEERLRELLRPLEERFLRMSQKLDRTEQMAAASFIGTATQRARLKALEEQREQIRQVARRLEELRQEDRGALAAAAPPPAEAGALVVARPNVNTLVQRAALLVTLGRLFFRTPRSRL